MTYTINVLVGHQICKSVLHLLKSHCIDKQGLTQALCIPSAVPSASKQLLNAVLSQMLPQLGTSTAVTSGSCCSAAVLVSSMTASTSESAGNRSNHGLLSLTTMRAF